MKLTQRQYEEAMLLIQQVTSIFGGDNEKASAFEGSKQLESTPYYSLSAEERQIVLERINSRRSQLEVQEEEARESIDGSLVINNISLEIFLGDGANFETLTDVSLSSFSLSDIHVKFSMLTDRSMEAELELGSMLLRDSRKHSNSHFKDFVPPLSSDNPQFQMSLSRQATGDIVVNATIDSPKVILVLDHLFALRDFWLSGLNYANTQTASDAKLKQKEEQAATFTVENPIPDGPKTHFRVSVINPEIILLAKPESHQSEAIILSASHIILVKQNTLVLTANDIGMVLCRMDARDDTTLSLIDNFDIDLTLDQNSAITGELSTTISIGVRPLVLRASHRDVMLMLGIVNKAKELASKAAIPFDEPVEPPSSQHSSRPVSMSAMSDHEKAVNTSASKSPVHAGTTSIYARENVSDKRLDTQYG
jgi:vacuolar protein sorting-associated protein 13A/C